MPVYEYKCRECGEKFEKVRGFFDTDADLKCPNCDASDPQQVYSLFARGSKDSCAPTSFS